MPNVPSQLNLPSSPDSGSGFGRWATNLLTGLQTAWSNMTFTLNALSQTESFTNRPATPALDHIFYTTDDTFRTYVGVDGVWKPVNTDWYNVVDYASFSAAITAIGASTATLLIPVDTAVTANITVPSTCTLWFVQSGKLTVSVAVTCTINGPIIAAPRQIFAGSGTVAFTSNRSLQEVFVQWWGAVGDDSTTTNNTAINAACTAASTAGGTGQKVQVTIPPGVYRCGGELLLKSNTKVLNKGHLKFTGGNAIGGFAIIRAQSNIEVTGGIWDSNDQQNDNTIAISFLNANQTVAGSDCADILIHDLTIKNALHGGSTIVDINDPADVGRGGGKGITVQFGCRRVLVQNVIIDDCDIGFSIEGKEADSGYCQDIHFNNVVVKSAKYMGAYLTSVYNTSSLIGQVGSALLSNITFSDCAGGQTTEGSPQDIAGLFGVITCNGATAIKANNIRVRNSTGTVTILRGAQRFSDWDIQAIVNNLADVVNTAGYGGYGSVSSPSRYNRVVVDLSIIGSTFSGYLVNNDATNDAESCIFEMDVVNFAAGTPAAVASSQYTQNMSSDSMLLVRDKFNARVAVQAFQSQSKLTLAAGSTLTIASGAVTATHSRHKLDTEGAAASDDLATINGGTTGQILILQTTNASRDVVVKDGTGNIRLAGSADFTLGDDTDLLTLLFDGTNWLELSRSDN